MLRVCGTQPHLPHRPNKDIDKDLDWWSNLLQNGRASRPIYPPTPYHNPQAYSDASSTIGIGIVIGKHWRAWRLIPGWETQNGQRDIGWAEAVGFELLVRTLATLPALGSLLTVYGDNTGVVEGWWKGRSRNREVNAIFRRIHEFIDHIPRRFAVHTTYVASEQNPADEPSRGIYPPFELLLPPIDIPPAIRNFIIDATLPPTATELQLLRNGRYPPPAAKVINRAILRQEGIKRAQAFREEEELFLLRAVHDSAEQ